MGYYCYRFPDCPGTHPSKRDICTGPEARFVGKSPLLAAPYESTPKPRRFTYRGFFKGRWVGERK